MYRLIKHGTTNLDPKVVFVLVNMFCMPKLPIFAATPFFAKKILGKGYLIEIRVVCIYKA
jgi:hypothetical protein